MYLLIFILVDCVWNEYGEWSSCTKTCGGGTRFRSRSKHIEDSNGGDKCTGSERQDEDCNNDECIGILVDYIFCFEILARVMHGLEG